MKKHIVSKVTLVGLCILVFSLGASAHENHTYRIGDKVYQINIGSLNEPVVVDDKTGLDLRVEHPAVGKGEPTPVTGLDQTLKVEIPAGGWVWYAIR